MIIFHLGYPKAASTTLQTYFIKDKRINDIGRLRDDRGILKIINALKYDNEVEFTKNLQEYKRLLYSFYKPECLNIFSNEELLDPFKSHYIFDLINRVNLLTAKKNKILIIIRDQLDLIESLYSQEYIFFKNKIKLNNVNKYIEYLIENNFLEYYNFNNFCFENFQKFISILPLDDLIQTNSRSQIQMKKMFNSSSNNTFDINDIKSIFQINENVTNVSIKKERYIRIDDILTNYITNNIFFDFLIKISRRFFNYKKREVLRKTFNYLYLKLLKLTKKIMIIFNYGKINLSENNKNLLREYFFEKNKTFNKKLDNFF